MKQDKICVKYNSIRIMKVLLINGSPKREGNTYVALHEVQKTLEAPVYYASPNGTLLSFLDRLFSSTSFDKSMKVGAAVAVARRGGTTATFDVLNKYFTISNMPVAPSQYWNNVHGGTPGEALQDGEGLQTMRQLARNMAFLVKSIQLGKEKFGLPGHEERIATNFIR